ncbi:hypothetical protein DPMN_079371 [Dreissena polymorpha]|uniref:Uncharacterized protein n=1 Tax=Dreissena polymorpha TaxID=45954 RepID=A0A9D3YSZ5_DREPO|nr:hypothetical protein DPMN_079371 [Dreissena polymorpha]
MRLLVYCFYLLVLWCHDSLGVQGDNDTQTEHDLHKRLFQTYNSNIMPRHATSLDPFDVGIELYLMSIDEINELSQTISIMAFLEITWKDRFLGWDPLEYSNITSIKVKVKDIWYPDVVLESTLDKHTDLMDEAGNANIKSDGSVVMWPYGRYTVSCKIFIGQYPFDKQTCLFAFLSWTNPSSKLVLSSASTEIRRFVYKENSEWALKRGQVLFERRPYGNDTWDHVIFCFELQRKSLFVVMNIMLPIVCIAFLNTFCFILPSDCGERITLCISLFLTLAVFMTIVNGSLPESSDEVSKFGVYVGLQLIGSGLSTIATVLSLQCYHEDDHTRVRLCVQLLVIAMCMRKRYQIHQKHANNEVNGNKNDGEIVITEIDTLDDCIQIDKRLSSGNGNRTTHNVPPVTWKMVSCALDRFCFIASIVWHVVLLCILLVVLVS